MIQIKSFMRTIKASILVASIFMVLNPPLSQSATPIDSAMLERLEVTVNKAMATYRVPGTAIAIVKGDDIIYAKGFGMRNIENQEPVTPDTRFVIYSMTKAMTATMMAILVDEGKLKWNQKAIKIWPYFKLSDEKLTKKVQVKHLMLQNTGLVEDYNMLYYDTRFDGISAETQLESLKQLSVGAKFKQKFEINDHTVSAGGYLATLASGAKYGHLKKAYQQLMQERIFEPIGMESVVFNTNLPTIGGNYATGYAFNTITEALEQLPFLNLSGYVPAAGISANVKDVARFIITHLNQGVTPAGKRIVSRKNLLKTRQPTMLAKVWPFDLIYPKATSCYTAMGWATVEQPNGVKMIGYTGGYEGFTTDMTMIPDAEVGIVIFTNLDIYSDAFSSVYFFAVVRERLFELLYGLEPTIEGSAAAKHQQESDAIAILKDSIQTTFEADTVASYLGNYEKGWRLELRPDKTLWLIFQRDHEYQLIYLPDGTYRIGNGSYLGRIISFLNEGDIIKMSITVGDIEIVRKIN